MQWTRELPTTAGWYWWKTLPEYEAQAVKVGKTGMVKVAGDSMHYDSKYLGGLWYGPLAVPGEGEQ